MKHGTGETLKHKSPNQNSRSCKKSAGVILQAICCLLVIAFTAAFAVPANAEANISLNLDRNEAAVGDNVQLTVNVEGAGGESPRISGLENFRVNDAGTSTQIQMVNGKFSRQTGHTYILQPTKPGVYTIGPASVAVSGRTYSSGTAVLTVTGQAAVPQAAGRGDIFLSASLAPKEAYPEQQIVYTLKLFFRQKIGNVSVDLPNVEGISFKQMGDSRQYVTTASGQSYQVLEVSYQLQPAKPGIFNIGAARMQMTLFERQRRNRNDFFDDDFFGSTRGSRKTISSEPVTLSVNRLPDAGRPADFTGLAGRFRLESRLEPSAVKAGDSATLTVQITGQGNVNRIPDITLPDMPGLKVYPDKPVLESATGPQGTSGTKTMKWAIVPQKPGIFSIPQFKVSCFDTDQKKYVSLATAVHALNVTQGEPQAQSALPAAAAQPPQPKTEVKTLGSDILPVHTSISDLEAGSDVMKNIPAAVLIMVLPAFIWLAAVLYIRFRNISIEQSDSIRAKKAARYFSIKFRKNRLTSIEMLEALKVFVNARFRLSVGLLTPQEAERILVENSVKQETTARLKDVISRLQQDIYTGRGGNIPQLSENLPELVSKINREAK